MDVLRHGTSLDHQKQQVGLLVQDTSETIIIFPFNWLDRFQALKVPSRSCPFGMPEFT